MVRGVVATWSSSSTYETAEDTIGDLGSTWTGVVELASSTGLTQSQVKGVLASLSNRGLIFAGDEGPEGNILQCLTEDGALAVYALRGADENGSPEYPTNKQVADALYRRPGNLFVTIAAIQMRVTKAQLWEALMKTPEAPAAVMLQEIEGGWLVSEAAPKPNG